MTDGLDPAHPQRHVTDTRWELVRHYLHPVARFFEAEGVTDIHINRFDTVYVQRHGQRERVSARWESELALLTTVEQIAAALDQPVHPEDAPRLDARLPDGTRISALLYPWAVRGTTMSIRRFPPVRLAAADLLAAGALTPEMLDYLRLAILARCNIVIAGGTGSGKTTLLNVLSGYIPDHERIASIEDTHELQLAKPDWVALEIPSRIVDGRPVMTMAEGVINALRMNPDRILVGEIRDAQAAAAVMTAVNTGHQGLMCTIHANDALSTVTRIANLYASVLRQMPYDILRQEVLDFMDLVVFVREVAPGDRRIVQLGELIDSRCELLWQWNYREP